MDKIFIKNCEGAGQIYRAINHPLRQQILDAIEGSGKTVTEIYVQLRLEQSVASNHLRILREAKLVKGIRNGKFTIYSINNEAMASLSAANMSLGFL